MPANFSRTKLRNGAVERSHGSAESVVDERRSFLFLLVREVVSGEKWLRMERIFKLEP